MAVHKYAGAPWLYDDSDGDIVGVKDPDGSEFFFARAGHFGSWMGLSDQTAAINTPTKIQLDTSIIENGIIVQDSVDIILQRAGKFNFTLTAQVSNSDSQIHNLYLWGRRNSTDIPGTMTRVSVPERHGSNDGSVILERTYFAALEAGDIIQVMWMTDNAGVSLQHYDAVAGPPARPSGPSVSLAVYEVAM